MPSTPKQPGEPPVPVKSGPLRILLLAVAVLSLGLGVVGIFLPLLPTVPFLLLAAWAAARSSPRLQKALLEHPRLGPPIKDWQSSGVIRRRAKVMATLAMAFSATMVLVLVANPWARAAAVGSMAAMLVWIWCRPEQAEQPVEAAPRG